MIKWIKDTQLSRQINVEIAMTKTHQSTQEILKSSKTVAIVGCSANPYRTSNYAAKYLMDRGYTMIPVNPQEEMVLGQKCYPGINDIPKETQIDIVNIFRNKRYTPNEVDEVVKWKQETSQNPVIWTQLDVSTPEAELKAEAAGLPYVRNACIMVELDRLH